jgi:hypothetical protein
MNGLKAECEHLVADVQDALGAAIVDLSTGLLLAGHHQVPYFTQTYIDAVAAAAVDMFRGRTVTNVEKLLANHRGHAVAHSIKEVQMTTDRTFHFMMVVPDKPNVLVVLITGRRANLGMGWTAIRSAVTQISGHL